MSTTRIALRQLLVISLMILAGSIMVIEWVGSPYDFWLLWKKWFAVMAGHQNHFDAAMIGSQSLLSVLLRVAKTGWITVEQSQFLWQVSALAIVCLHALFWLIRRPLNARGKALFFSQGIFLFLLLMPEMFKHALLFLAMSFVPLIVADLEKKPKPRIWPWCLLFFGFSITGVDVLRPWLAHYYQLFSIPFGVVFSLMIWTFFEAKKESAFWTRIVKSEQQYMPSLTADDWGMGSSINLGILHLARAGLIRRVSVMAGLQKTKFKLEELKAIHGIEIGIHFNLTYGIPFGVKLGPGQVLYRWFTGTLTREMVRNEFKRQIELLKSSGIKPNYFDSHHHCHLIPGLVTSLSDLIREEGIQVIRTTYDARLWFTSKFVLNVLALINRVELYWLGFRWRPCCYPQSSDFANPQKLTTVLYGKDRHDVIVHPAMYNDFSDLEFYDSMTTSRVEEFEVLMTYF